MLCVDARMLFASGIGTYLQGLLPYFVEGLRRVSLIVDAEMPLERCSWIQRCELLYVSASIYSLKEQWRLPRIIPRVDLFWSPHYNIPLGPIRARHRCVTIHDLNHLAFQHLLSWPERCYARWMLQQAMTRSEGVMTVSQFSRREIARYFRAQEARVEVIYPGVDGRRFSPHATSSDQAILTHYQLPERYVLFVGNRKPHKNVRALLIAMQQVEALSLVVVGKKKSLRHVEHEVETLATHPSLLGRIHSLEHVTDEELPALYRGAFVTVMPSFYEGFGSPALEALASGSPVAVSHAASLPEVCGEAALYFNPECPEEIGSILRALLRDEALRMELRDKGLIRASQFSWARSAEAHLRFMQSFLSS